MPVHTYCLLRNEYNLKALYLYLTAEYSTQNNILNEMVLWDKIVMNGEKMDIDMKSAKVLSNQIFNFKIPR